MSRIRNLRLLWAALVSGCGLPSTPTPPPPTLPPPEMNDAIPVVDSGASPGRKPGPSTLAALIPPQSGALDSHGITDQGEFICRQHFLLHPSPVTSEGHPADGYEVSAELEYASTPGKRAVVRPLSPLQVWRLYWKLRRTDPVPIPRPSQALLRRIAPGLFPQPPLSSSVSLRGSLANTACRDKRIAVEMPQSVSYAFIAPGIHRFTATGAAQSVVRLLGERGVFVEWNLSVGDANRGESVDLGALEVCRDSMRSLDLEVLCAGDFVVVTALRWQPIADPRCARWRHPCPGEADGDLPCILEPMWPVYPEKGVCEFDELKRTRFRFSTGEREQIELFAPAMELGTM